MTGPSNPRLQRTPLRAPLSRKPLDASCSVKVCGSCSASDSFFTPLKGKTINRRKEIEKAALAASVIMGVLGAGLLGACAQAWNRGEMQANRCCSDAFVWKALRNH